MGGMEIIAMDKKGKIKQDLSVSRDNIKGKIVAVDKLKAKQIKEEKK